MFFKLWIKKMSCALLALMILAVSFPTMSSAAENRYNAVQKGSITISLNDIGTPMHDVNLTLYQVGEVIPTGGGQEFIYTLTKDFANMSLDLNQLKKAEEIRDAAKQCMNYLPEKPHFKGVTAKEGTTCFRDLMHGVYLICKPDPCHYGDIEPYLVFMPHMTDEEEGWIYDVVTSPKSQATEEKEGYSISVTKEVKFENEYLPIHYTFYAALFSDQRYLNRVTDIMELNMNGNAATIAVFDNLEAGTYYLAETDKDGKAIIGQSQGEIIYTNEITDTVLTLTPLQANSQSTIINHIKEKPPTPPESSKPPEPSKPSEPTEKVRTGDSNGFRAYAVVFGVDVLIIVLLMIVRRRKNNS